MKNVIISFFKKTKRRKRSKSRVYENMPQRKLVLKKNYLKIVEGLFKGEEKIQTILKAKEGKRTTVLNLYIRETLQSNLKNENDILEIMMEIF